MRAVVLVGTRPEIIKTSPLLREARRGGHRLDLVHTGQHWEDCMDAVFFRELELDPPDVALEPAPLSVRGLVDRLVPALVRLAPDLVFVQGDTTSALAGALAADRAGIQVAHVEAGLRSFDERMVEEHNRRAIDLLSRLLFCPTPLQIGFLHADGITGPGRELHVVGNTVADALLWALPKLGPRALRGRYAVLTLHRPENVDHPARFRSVLDAVERVARELGLAVRWPVHPRVSSAVPAGLRGIEPSAPLGYFEFLELVRDAEVVFTDSGGLQEETAVLGVPCVTLRRNTERQETLARGSNRLADTAAGILEAIDDLRGIEWQPHAYGPGDSARRILDATERWLVMERSKALCARTS